VTAGLLRANECAHELAIDNGRNRVDINATAGQELAGVFDIVDAGRFDADRLKSSGGDMR
jgi:hypothetical protein